MFHIEVFRFRVRDGALKSILQVLLDNILSDFCYLQAFRWQVADFA